jgi:hypothetical protein
MHCSLVTCSWCRQSQVCVCVHVYVYVYVYVCVYVYVHVYVHVYVRVYVRVCDCFLSYLPMIVF